MHLLEWLGSKILTPSEVAEGQEQLELSHSAGGSITWFSCFEMGSCYLAQARIKF
jgi:hypothetical protein